MKLKYALHGKEDAYPAGTEVEDWSANASRLRELGESITDERIAVILPEPANGADMWPLVGSGLLILPRDHLTA